MNIVDDSYKTLREEGYEGSKSDLVYKKLRDLTGLSSSTPDMWYQWLRSLGYNGSVNDMLSQHLVGKGYGSSLQDALALSFSNRDLYYANEGMTALFDIQRYINSGVATNFEGLFDITRSSSKYVYGTGAQTGQLIEVPPNTPAYQHDPVTGAPLGLSVEGGATNLFEYSEDFLQSYWIKERTEVLLSPEPSVFVGGVTHKIEETAVTNSFRLRANVSTSALDYSPYFFVKAAERSKVRVFVGNANASADFDLTSGTISNEVSCAGFSEELANGFWKVGIKLTQPTATTATLHLLAILDDAGNFTYAGEVGKGIYVCHADLKQEAKPSSPVVTNGTTVTRSGDTLTANQVANWWNSQQGTFIFDISSVDTLDLIPDFGFARITAGTSGKVGIRFTTAGGEVWTNNTKQFDIPYNILAEGFEWVTGLAEVATTTFSHSYDDLSSNLASDFTIEPLFNFIAGSSLATDFENQQFWSQNTLNTDFDTLLDISRTSTKYVYGTGANTGKLVEVPANTPAYDHDPVTGEPKGLLVEPSATNLLLWSSDFTQTAWVKTESSISASSQASPLPSENMQLVQPTNANGAQLYQNISGVTESTTYTAEFYAKTSGSVPIEDNLCSFYDLSNAAFITLRTKPTKLFELPNGIAKFAISVTTPVGCTSLRFYMVHTNVDPIKSFEGLFWGAELKLGNTASSYIPTTTSTVTRAADIVTSDAATFGDWFNASAFDYNVTFRVADDSSLRRIIYFDDGTTANRIILQRETNRTFSLVNINSGGGSTTIANFATELQGQENTVKVRYDGAKLYASGNGGAESSATTPVSTAITRVQLGGPFYLNGTLKLFAFED